MKRRFRSTYRHAGACVASRVDFPEKGVSMASCVVILRDLPAPFVGGLLTSSSLQSNAVLGGSSNPPGYAQTSIATVRLWK